MSVYPPQDSQLCPPIENRPVASDSQELLRAVLKSGGRWQRQQRYLEAPQTGQP